jgi:hypothetical protein
MKRYFAICLLGLLAIGLSTNDILAHGKKFVPPDSYITLSFFLNPNSIGYRHLVSRNLYLTGNLDYRRSKNNLTLQAGTAYMIPKRIVIFRFYGGGGMEYSRNQGYMYPYVLLGTKLWILHFDVVHTLRKENDPRYRLGFMFSF